MDVIVTQGGGDGKNPRRPLWVEINKDRTMGESKTFDYFGPGRGRATKFMKSPEDGTFNLMITGFATPAQMKTGASDYYKNVGGGGFEYQGTLPHSERLGYRAVVTDFNTDGIDDTLFFGGSKIVAARGNADGSFTDTSETVFGDLAKIKSIHAVTEIDFDNDGDFDLLLTRAEMPFTIDRYFNAEENRFAFQTFRKDFLFDDMTIDGDMIIDNLQRSYPDFDLFMGASKAKYAFTGDKHGHQDLTIKPEDAKGWPEGELKNGLYIGYLGDGVWRVGGHTHSRWAGAIRNVMSTPSVSKRAKLPAYLLENKGGTFADVTARSGIIGSEQTTGATAADFNNDGLADLAVLKSGNMASMINHYFYLNQGGGVFKPMDDHGVTSTDVGATGGSAEAFDYDVDGNVDMIFSNERGRWHLLKNTMTDARDNNFLIVQVGKAPKAQTSPQSALAKVTACGQTYMRRVGSSSSSFSHSMDTNLHFGLGQCAKIDSISVVWANKEAQLITSAAVNTAVSTDQ